MPSYDSLVQEWNTLIKEYENAEASAFVESNFDRFLFQISHEEYLRLLKDTNRLQNNSAKNVKQLVNRSGQVRNELKK